MELQEQDVAILAMERSWWTRPGTKQAQIADTLEISLTRYNERLGQVIESPGAFEHDPLLVLRLRRMRDQRRRLRRRVKPTSEESC